MHALCQKQRVADSESKMMIKSTPIPLDGAPQPEQLLHASHNATHYATQTWGRFESTKSDHEVASLRELSSRAAHS